MRTLIFFLAITLLGCSHTGPIRLYPGNALPPQQEAILILPEAFELIKINQEEIPASTFAFRTSKAKLRLAPGPNEIIVQYRTLWDITSDQHQIVESGPIQFRVNLDSNQKYTFKWQDPVSFETAAQFANNPTVEIVGNDDTWRGQHKPKQSDLILIADPKESEQNNKSHIALDKLQYWWQRANLDEQEAFRKIIEAKN